MYNVGRQAEILDEFGVWVPGIINEKINESFLNSIFLRSCPKAYLWFPY